MTRTRTINRGAAAALLALALTVPPAAPPADAAPTRASGIVFVSDRDSPSPDQMIDEVYLLDPSTGHTSRLTNNRVAEQFPVLSPDGRYLAYLSATGISVCRLSYAAGDWTCGAARGVVSNPAPTGGKFAWTPDGRSIVYGGEDPIDGDGDVFSVGLYSFQPARNLTQEAPGEAPVFDGHPAVSPDGRHVVYGHDGDLYRRRIDGSHAVRLTSTAGVNEYGPAYSPDGSMLAFHSNRRAANLDIYVMRPRPESSGNPAVDLTERLTAPDGTPSRERFPSWSPDGSQIAFWWGDLEDGEIYSVRADGGAVRNLTANNDSGPPGRPIGDVEPSWGVPRRR